jgi:hypothetical protein
VAATCLQGQVKNHYSNVTFINSYNRLNKNGNLAINSINVNIAENIEHCKIKIVKNAIKGEVNKTNSKNQHVSSEAYV